VRLTTRQISAVGLIKAKRNVLLFGGSRSGKTVVAIDFIIHSAYKYPGLRALVARRYATDVRASIWTITLPQVLRARGYELGVDYTLNEATMTVTFSSGGTIICSGLDDKERVDKVLGQEYAIIYLNESQDVPWPTVTVLRTRLSQTIEGFTNRFMCDLNPTSTAHWTYKLWFQKIHPESRKPVNFPNSYGYLQMNPNDNRENLPAGYIENELESLVGSSRDRFFLGNYADTSALRVFTPKHLYHWPEFEEWAATRQGILRFIAGLDLGYQDADAFVILAYVPNERDVWLVFEHKARRETLDQLVESIRRGMRWVADNIPARDHSMKIYAETATVRYGHEGDDKKSASMLAETFGLPIERAYKRDKKLGIELLQGEVNAGFFHVPAGGPFHDESEQTVWTRENDGTIVRIIDDEAFHPDEMDAILYPSREIYSYSGEEHRQLPPGPEAPPLPSADDRVLNQMIETLNTDEAYW